MQPPSDDDRSGAQSGAPDPERRIDLREAIRVARDRISGSKGAYMAMAGFYVLVLGGTGVLFAVPIAEALFPTPTDAPVLDPRADAIVVAFLALASAPFQGGFLAAGLARVDRRPIRFGFVFRHLRMWPRFFGLALLIGLVGVVTAAWGVVGSMLSLAVSILLGFAGYFLVDRHLELGDAMIHSAKMVAANAGAVAMFYLLTAALGLLVVATLGIALPWVVPFAAIGTAVLYQQGAGLARSHGDEDGADASTRP
ncbi:MAG: hypothetical protein WD336_08830 [Trueperaceae bacterium]